MLKNLEVVRSDWHAARAKAGSGDPDHLVQTMLEDTMALLDDMRTGGRNPLIDYAEEEVKRAKKRQLPNVIHDAEDAMGAAADIALLWLKKYSKDCEPKTQTLSKACSWVLEMLKVRLQDQGRSLDEFLTSTWRRDTPEQGRRKTKPRTPADRVEDFRRRVRHNDLWADIRKNAEDATDSQTHLNCIDHMISEALMKIIAGAKLRCVASEHR